MFRRFDFWTSRNRSRLAVAFAALLLTGFGLSALSSATDVAALAVPGALALLLAFPVLIALAVGIRHGSGGGDGGGGFPGIGDGGGC